LWLFLRHFPEAASPILAPTLLVHL
jgi:hypothetical protein